jgi:hypothetical protein
MGWGVDVWWWGCRYNNPDVYGLGAPEDDDTVPAGVSEKKSLLSMLRRRKTKAELEQVWRSVWEVRVCGMCVCGMLWAYA